MSSRVTPMPGSTANSMAWAPATGSPSRREQGIAHCFLNNTEGAVRLLIIGERHPEDRVAYPLNPERHAAPNNWSDAPARPLGKHDGRAKQRA